MGSFSVWHWLILAVLGLLLFGGKGKISDLMGDVAKGIKSFKKGMAEDDDAAKKPDGTPATPKSIDALAKPVQHAGSETSKVN
jgi:sec-independent protein translocase protein TatA